MTVGFCFGILKSAMKKLIALASVLAVLGKVGTVPTFAAPATLNPTADSYVYSTSPNSTHGDETSLRSGFWVEFQQKYISLLKFDLASIPDDATITSAELKLRVKSGISSGTMTASRNTEDWTEGRVNWSTRPSSDGPRASALVSSGSSYIPWDVTELVEDWFNGDHANYGFSIVATAQETDFSADFFSREASENHPELIISYDRPLPTPTEPASGGPTPTTPPEAEDETDDEAPPTTPSEPIPDRPVVVEEETTPSDDEPWVISPSTPSAKVATPSAQPTSMLGKTLQIVPVVFGLLFIGVAGYVIYKGVKKRQRQKEPEGENQEVAQPSKDVPNQD